MPLEKLREQLHEEAKQQSVAVMSEAKSAAKKIREEAEEQAKLVAKEAQAKALKEAQAKEVELYSTRLAAKKILAEARNEVVEEVFRELKNEFASFVKTRDYEKFLKKTIDEGKKGLGSDAVTHVNARDAALAKKFGKTAAEPINAIGGAVLVSQDGRIHVDNTVEALLAERRDEIRLAAFEEFFPKRERENEERELEKAGKAAEGNKPTEEKGTRPAGKKKPRRRKKRKRGEAGNSEKNAF